MTLLDLCEPLFQYICRLNRSARKGVIVDHDKTRAEITAILDSIRSDAMSGGELGAQYQKIELVLLFFVDSTIMNSRLSFALDWSPLQLREGQLVGEQKFFEMLDETLRETGPSANERLAVYFTCLGLGFTGIYEGQEIQSRMQRISARIGDKMDTDPTARICPEAYKYTDSTDMTASLAEPVGKLSIVMVGLICVLVTAIVMMYRQQTNELGTVLDDIAGRQLSGATAAEAVENKEGGR